MTSTKAPEPRTQVPGEGTMTTETGHRLPLTRTGMKARIAGPIAAVDVEQRFDNDGEDAIEVRYAFPLPKGASVHRLSFQIDDRIVDATVKTRAEARRVYETARAGGRTATLLEEDEPSLFTMSVANVPAGARVMVRLAYHELLGYDDGEWRFVFPLVAPERYREMNADLPTGHRLAPPRLPTGKRSGDVSLDVMLESDHDIDRLRCATHRVRIERNESRRARITLDASDAIANRDFVLTFRAGDAGVRPFVRFERSAGEDGTFLAVLTPSAEGPVAGRRRGPGELGAITCGNCGGLIGDPTSVLDVPGIGPAFPCGFCGAILAPSPAGRATRAMRPRDVVILVDRSASMRASLPQARRAVGAILEGLAPGDAVQVLAFDHERVAFDGDGGRFVTISPQVARRVDSFLAELTPRGGTELDRALREAAALPKREDRTRLIAVITDAAVGNTKRLVRRAEVLANEGTRIYALGLGPAVDRYLVGRIAEAGAGAADFLDEVGDVEPTMKRFVKRVVEAGPVITGLSIAIEGAEVEKMHPAALPDLYAGQPVHVVGRFRGEGAAKLVVTGATASGAPFRQELEVQMPPEADEAPGLERLWARARIEDLCERIDDERGDARRLEKEATELALGHDLVSRFTSLVAEDDEVVTDEEPRRVDVPTPVAAEAVTSMAAPAGRVRAHMSTSRAGAPPPPACAPAPRRPRYEAEDEEMEACLAEGVGAISTGYVPEVLSAPKRRKSAVGAAAGVMRRVFGGRRPAPETPGCIRVDEHTLEHSHQIVAEPPGSDAYDADELKWLESKKSGELDLVFLVDETGSMGPYIEQVKARLLDLVAALKNAPLCKSLRLGLVTYRDHPPQDHSYPSRAFALTSDVDSIAKAVRAMRASGGGDGPESVTDGLFDVVRMDWRPSAAKAVVWFGDAPPHGVEPSGDGFPQGCPCGNHWYAQAESCREMGIAIYAVGCLPGLRGYVGAEKVFRTVAQTTRGTYLPLSSAELLVPLICGAALTELDKQRVDAHLSDLVDGHRDVLSRTDEAERVRWLTRAMVTRGVRPRSMAYEPGSRKPAPLAFREITAADVQGSLDRLRLAGRAGV